RPAGALAVAAVQGLDVGPVVLRHLPRIYWIAVEFPGPGVALDLHRPPELVADHAHVRARLPRHAHLFRIEAVRRATPVPEDRVVLAAEGAPALPADRVAPDDLVHERGGAEDPIELHLDRVHGAPVEVHEERAGRGEHATELLQAGAHPGDERFGAAQVLITPRPARLPRPRAAPP